MAVVAALLVIWLVIGYFVVVRPRVNRLAHADAVVVLGPYPADGRIDSALHIVDEGYADTLALSAVPAGVASTRRLCTTVLKGRPIICFTPQPATTLGEARQIRDLARRYNWHTLIVVTSKYHISRARVIVERCFDGEVIMRSSGARIGLGTWAYQYLYQTGAYLKLLFRHDC